MSRSRWWAVLAAVALATATVLLLVPTGSSQTCTATSGEPAVCTRASTVLLSSEGPWVLVPLSLPALACLLPLVLRSRVVGWVVAVALVVFCLLTGFTVGLFFLPVALAALVLAFHGIGPTRGAEVHDHEMRGVSGRGPS